jgi:hypothetical protein
MERCRNVKVQTALGTVAVACYAAHAAVHLGRGEPQDLLWACHVAALLVGAGFLFASPTLNAIGFLWSCYGTPLWILDLATGGEWMPTALLTHFTGLVIGFIGVRRLGLPRHAAWKAMAAYALLFLATRALTPPRANVNLAFSVYQGWQLWFASYPLYLAMLVALGLGTFLAAEHLLAPLARRERAA